MAMRLKKVTHIPTIIETDEKEVVLYDTDGKKVVATLLPEGADVELKQPGAYAVHVPPSSALGYQKDEKGWCRVLPLQSVSM